MRTKSFRADSRRFLAAGIPRRFCLCGELRRHIGRVAPQTLQSVKATAVLGEDVKDEIAEVEKDPAAGGRSFDEKRSDFQLLAEFFEHTIGDEQLSLRRGVFGDTLLPDLRVGADGKLYQLSTSPDTGITVTRFPLG